MKITFGGMLENLKKQHPNSSKIKTVFKQENPITLEESKDALKDMYSHLSQLQENFPNLESGVSAMELYLSEKGITGPDVVAGFNQIRNLEKNREKAQSTIRNNYNKSPEFNNISFKQDQLIKEVTTYITDRDTMMHVFMMNAKQNPVNAREIKYFMSEYLVKYKNQTTIDPEDARDIATMLHCPTLLDQLMKSDQGFRTQEEKIFNELMKKGNRADVESSEPIGK